MARQIFRLKPLQVKQAKKPGMYPDGGGLYLQVTSAAAKSWVFRYASGGRERYMGLGSVNTFSLSEAREKARNCRQLLQDKADPIERRLAERDAQRGEVVTRISFKEATERFIALHEPHWRNDKHRQQWRNTLVQYAYPLLGSRPVSAIDDALINEAVRPIWTETPETARRVKQRIGRIVDWVRKGRPLPSRGKTAKERQPALPYGEMPAFMADLRIRNSISARALEVTALTAMRSNEVIGGKWAEIDLAAKVWTVPADRMKAGREHRVPLSDRVLAILNGLPRETGNPHVFIGGRVGKPLSNMAMTQLLRGMNDEREAGGLPRYVDPKQNNRDIVPHGLRSTFRDWAGDCTSYPNHICEMALAHAVRGVEGDYRRGDLFEKRRRLMMEWSRYCETRVGTGEVVPLRKAGA
jgi:integrase